MYSGELRAIFSLLDASKNALSIQDFFGYSGKLRAIFRLTTLGQLVNNSGVQFKHLNKYGER